MIMTTSWKVSTWKWDRTNERTVADVGTVLHSFGWITFKWTWEVGTVLSHVPYSIFPWNRILLFSICRNWSNREGLDHSLIKAKANRSHAILWNWNEIPYYLCKVYVGFMLTGKFYEPFTKVVLVVNIWQTQKAALKYKLVFYYSAFSSTLLKRKVSWVSTNASYDR